MNVTNENIPNKQDSVLSTKQVIFWGAIGGFFCLVATFGLYDVKVIGGLIAESTQINNQIIIFLVAGIILIALGALWARAHVPLTSIAVAIQLGMLAPSTINAAFISSGQVDNVAKEASSEIETGYKETNSSFPPPIVRFGIASAHAHTDSVLYLNDKKTGLIRCIVYTLQRKPC